MQEWIKKITPETIAEDRSAETVDWLMRYVANAWNLLNKSQPAVNEDAEKSPSEKMARCLLCTAKLMLPSSITRHCQNKHKSVFEHSLFCFECLRLRLELIIVHDGSEWSDHVKKMHGKIHAPQLEMALLPEESGPACFLCKIPLLLNALKHFSQLHADQFSLNRLFQFSDCPEADGEKQHIGESLFLHLAEHHGYPSVKRCSFCGLFCTGRELSAHMRGHFKKEAAGSVECPRCVAPQEGDKRQVFSDFSAWLIHATRLHDHGHVFAPSR